MGHLFKTLMAVMLWFTSTNPKTYLLVPSTTATLMEFDEQNDIGPTFKGHFIAVEAYSGGIEEYLLLQLAIVYDATSFATSNAACAWKQMSYRVGWRTFLVYGLVNAAFVLTIRCLVMEDNYNFEDNYDDFTASALKAKYETEQRLKLKKKKKRKKKKLMKRCEGETEEGFDTRKYNLSG